MLKVAILLLSVIVPGSLQQCFSHDDIVPFITREEFDGWVQSHRSFSVSLLKTLTNGNSHRNIVFSPWSIQHVLLLAYFGAARDTEEALARVLQIPDHQTKPVNWEIYDHERTVNFGNNITSNQLKSATKIFLSNKLNVRRCIAERFRNDLELIDYQGNVQSAQIYINYWVASQTGGQITDLIQNLSPSATATLVSAFYFEANWANEFNPKLTRLAPFHVNQRFSRPTNMMVKTDSFVTGHSKELQARFVFLPYEGKQVEMIIVLPDKDLDSTINAMTERSLSVITRRSSYKKSYFEIFIPKFEQKSDMDLTTALEKLGIGDTLTKFADFSGFTGKDEVFFNGVVHQAMIKVDEEGTMASAATGGITSYSAKIPSKPFICDRPFLYIIYDDLAKKIILFGTFVEPKSQ